MGICDGRTVIVTGAGGGLGKAYALALAAENKAAQETLRAERKRAAEAEKKLERLLSAASDGEEKLGRQLGVDWWTIGEGFSWDSEDLSRDAGVAAAAGARARDVILAGCHELVSLDEIA